MSLDTHPTFCVVCSEVIHSCVDEAWPWEMDSIGNVKQVGPMHHECAVDSIAEDPNNCFADEPTDAMVGARQYDARDAMRKREDFGQ